MSSTKADLSHEVIGAAIEVHRRLGPGLLESAYRTCMQIELGERGVRFETELEIPLIYKSKRIEYGFRVDFLIENELILELKAVDLLLPVHAAQVLTYMKLMNRNVGLLINFNEYLLVDGVKRFAL